MVPLSFMPPHQYKYRPSIPGDELLSLSSPDDNITLISFLDEENNLNYEVYFKNRKIIKRSSLDILLNGVDIGKNCEITGTETRVIDEVYDVPIGKSNKARNYCNEGIITVKASDILYNLVFRAYNDGAAFRYYFPAGLENVEITEEYTHFNFPCDYRAYALKLNTTITPTGYVAYSYEDHYNKTSLSSIDKDAFIGMPLLLEGKDFYAAITEASLKDYGGAHLIRKESADLVTSIAKSSDTLVGRSPFTTPWRVIMIGEKLADLVESDIVLNLNDRCKIKDTSWIVPGKAVWPWWTGQAIKIEVFKNYVDFASEHRIPYLMVDAGWYCPEDVAWSDPLNQDVTKDINLSELIGYGSKKNVRILLWVHGATLSRQLDEALKIYAEWGVAGIKVDDWGREDPEWVDFLYEIAEKAANYKMIVDFHGTYKPAGLRKVYPNVLTIEAVLGLEYSKWSDKCNLEHEVTIPFTRMLVGPMDFTPGAVAKEWFGDKSHVEGTVARQLAMYIVYESSLQMLVDYPAAYEKNRKALSFLEIVPTTWDETHLVDGKVGDYVVIARRSGKNWFVGGMTDEKPRALDVALDFLDEGKYLCDLYTDPAQASGDPVEHSAITVKKDSIILIGLVSGGGFAAHLQRKD
ncbi:MAG: glycoside hydrolase family 97 protein [Candidatus Thermoplasmatota archaeon]|nr:glycoside hydrolase family 97 protein [Candidatus Thermoplasmatota archaeon]